MTIDERELRSVAQRALDVIEHLRAAMPTTIGKLPLNDVLVPLRNVLAVPDAAKDGELRRLARHALDILQCLRVAFPSSEGNAPFGDTVVPLRAALKVDPSMFHVLRHGHTLCGLGATPNQWPDGEDWLRVSQVSGAKVTICDECRTEYDKQRALGILLDADTKRRRN